MTTVLDPGGSTPPPESPTENDAPDADTDDPRRPGPTPSAATALRRLVLRLHFYAGLLVGPFLMVAALSGAAYAIAPTVESIVDRHELTAATEAQTVSLTAQTATAQALHPGLEVSSVVAGRPGETTRVLFADPGLPSSSYQRVVFVDPGDGSVRGDSVQYGSGQALPLRTWLSEFHRRLHLGEPGRVYSELAASWLAPIALGGLYLWWGRRRREGGLFRVRRDLDGRAAQRSRHAVWGTWALLGMLVLSATGLTWSTYAGARVTDLRSAMGWTTPTLAKGAAPGHEGHDGHPGGDGQTDHSHMDHGGMDHGSMDHGGMDHGSMDHAPAGPMAVDPATPADTVLAAARADGLVAPLQVTPPSTPGAPWQVKETRRSWDAGPDAVAVDAATGQVVQRLPFDSYPLMAKLADWGIRLHMGFLFGLANQLLLAVLALAIAAITVRGYVMWWMRRPTRGRAGRLGVARPPVRGALSELLRTRPVATLAAAAVVVAVGWAVPLLGLSLLGFLLLDLLLGWVGRLRGRLGGRYSARSS